MKRLHLILSALLLAALPAPPAVAHDDDPNADLPGSELVEPTPEFDDTTGCGLGPDPTTLAFKIYWENDGSLHNPFSGSDRHYTNGFAIVVEHQPQWAERLIKYMPFDRQFEKAYTNTTTGAGYLLSQLIFTPANLSATAPIPTDQPYAGYLYTGAFLQRQGYLKDKPNVSVLDHFEFNIGVVGEEALGYDIQEWVHTNFDGVDPRGWDNQLASEITAQFFYKRKWRIGLGAFEAPLFGNLEMELIPQVGIALGTVYRNVSTAATFRIGHNLPDNFGPGRIDDLQSATGNIHHTYDGWSWYAFARLGGRLVEHELFLDGSNYTSSQSVDREVGVAEVQGGVAFSYRYCPQNRFDFTWGVTFHTDTFDAPGDRGTQSYGTLVFSWVKTF